MGVNARIDVSEKDLNNLHQLLTRYLPNTKVWAFGSRVKWTSRSDSDLDLVVFATKEQSRQVHNLKDALQESSLPFRVDVLVWDNIPDTFRENIKQQYIVLIDLESSKEWQSVLLGDVTNYKKCFAFKSKDYTNSGVPVIRVSNFTDNSISPSDLKFVSLNIREANQDVQLAEHDIVIATVGSWQNNPASVVGKTITVPKWASGALMNQNSVIIRAKSKQLVDQLFIYYQMKSSEFSNHVVSKAQGSANQASITLDAIFSFPLYWANEDERKFIVGTLHSLDDRITLLRETNATLEAIAQALFKSWFVDFDPVHAKMQGTQPEGMDEQTAALFPDSFEESELGLVPAGWEVGTLGDIVTTAKKQLQVSNLTSEFNYVGLEHIPRKSLSLTDWGNAEGLENAKSAFSKGDILFGKLRPYFHKVVVAPFDGVCSTDILVCQPQIPAYYGITAMLLFSTALISYAERLSNGAKMPRVNWKDLANYPVCIPPEHLAANFTETVTPLFSLMAENVHKSQTLADLRDTLLPRLISGQLRVGEI